MVGGSYNEPVNNDLNFVSYSSLRFSVTSIIDDHVQFEMTKIPSRWLRPSFISTLWSHYVHSSTSDVLFTFVLDEDPYGTQQNSTKVQPVVATITDVEIALKIISCSVFMATVTSLRQKNTPGNSEKRLLKSESQGMEEKNVSESPRTAWSSVISVITK